MSGCHCLLVGCCFCKLGEAAVVFHREDFIENREGTVMRWIRYSVTGLLGLIVVLAAAGALYQLIGPHVDQQKLPPPGKLIDVGGYRLHLYCTGAGSPTVVMEAMSGGWSVYWSTVQPEIAKMTRICSYDRAGYGWSDPGPTPR